MPATDKLEVRLKPVIAAKVRKAAIREGVSISAWLAAAVEQKFNSDKPRIRA